MKLSPVLNPTEPCLLTRIQLASLLRAPLQRVLLLVLILWLASCTRAPLHLSLSGPTMGTGYVVKVAELPAGVGEPQIRDRIDAVLARIDRSMSGYRTDSELARFNASSSTDWIAVSSDLAKVVAAALQVSEQSAGVLDITVSPLVEMWGFGSQGPRSDIPSEQEIVRARSGVGFRKLHVRQSPPALRKDDPALTVDLNAVAPGYAVDLLAAELTRLSLADFMIDIGGEVRVSGRNEHGRSWRIAVERPVDGEPQPYVILELTDQAVSTSGDYRHYDVRAGRRFSHTIDPRTGRPIEHELAAVIVVSSTAVEADAWATAFNVLGEEAGYALAASREMPVMFLSRRNGQVVRRVTRWFEPYLSASLESK
jgi:FAD:protein FMN transferase